MTDIPARIGRYEVIGRIAQGGMGAVYRAWDPKLDRMIAVKIMIHDGKDLRERFAREARSVARLRHPNIVTIFDVGDFDGRPFIAMEYIYGDTLADLIQKREPIGLPRRLELIEALCDALAFAHQMGIIHRDVKPANAIVDANGVLKVLDFGIARISESSSMTQTGATIGTFNYMSPEQLLGRAVDHRSDIFAVGAVLYELLSYRQAFPGGLESGLIDNLLYGKLEPLETFCPGLDPEVVRIVRRALEIDVRLRYQDLATMMKDLQRVRLQLPVTDHAANVPPSPVASNPPLTPPGRSLKREDLSRRRGAQIEAHLTAAKEAFSSGDFDAAIASCEQVLMLDSEDHRALELLDRTRTALDKRQAEEWLAEAEQEIRRGALTAALAKIEQAAALHPSSVRAAELRKLALDGLEERLRAKQRAEALQQVLDRAHAHFDLGQFRQAAAAAEEALALEPTLTAAVALRAQSLEAIEAQAREAHERAAREAIREARRLFSAGSHDAAVALLARFEPTHELVSRTLEQLRAEALRIAEQQRLEAELRAKQARIAEELSRVRTDIEQQEFGLARDRLRALEEVEGRVPDGVRLMQEIDAGEAELNRAAAIEREIAEHVAKAAVLFAKQDLDASLTRVNAALALDPNHGAARTIRSKIDDRLRVAAERREANQRRDAERQRELEAALTEAQHAGSHEAAITALRRAVEIAPEHAEARRLLDNREALLVEEQAQRRRLREVEHARREQVQALLRDARQLLARGDLDAARDRLRSVREIDPRNRDAQDVSNEIDGVEERRHAASVAIPQPTVADFPRSQSRASAIEPSEVAQPRPRKPVDLRAVYAVVGAILAIGLIVLVALRPSPSPVDDAGVKGVKEPPSSSTKAPPPSTDAKLESESIDQQLVGFRKLTRDQLARGDRAAALTTATTGLKLRPGDPELKKILTETLNDARLRLTRSHAAATAVGSSAIASASYRAASVQERDSTRLARAGRTDDAVRAAWLGADLFDKAADEGRKSAGREPIPDPVPPPPTRPAETPRTPERTTLPERPPTAPPSQSETPPTEPVTRAPGPVTPTPPPTAPPPPTPTPTSVAQEEEAIRSVIHAYADGYSRLDVAAIKRVYPNANEDALRRAFAPYKSQRVQIQNDQITIDGTMATVSCTLVTVVEFEAGRPNRASPRVVLRLQKTAGTWTIVDRR
jgi:serine/threonine protein kinase